MNKTKQAVAILLSFIFLISCGQKPVKKIENQSQTRSIQIAEQLTIDSVWAANKVSFALRTVGNKQFVAYYDKNRMMTVASRDLNSQIWQKKTLSNQLHWDSHNYVVIGIDELGYLHISGNMHVNPLSYYRSTKPFDINSIIELNKMVGEDETSVTYPKFFYDKAGKLYFSYRSGTCGNGNVLVNQFDPEQGKWKRYLEKPLFEGIEANDDRAAYHQFAKDKDGNFHFVWMWRWTPMVETCHQLCYATSPDLIHWKNAAGEDIPLPFRPDNEKLIVDGTPSKGGMHNGKYKIVISPDQKPLIGYVKYDEKGLTQFYLANFIDGKWLSKKISDWDFSWKFVEGGDQMTEGGSFNIAGFSDEGLLVIDWKTETGKSGKYVVDPKTMARVQKKVFLLPEYPGNIEDKLSGNPDMSVNLSESSGTVDEPCVKFVLKWESMGASHGKHAPKVIPAGPVSPLILLKIKSSWEFKNK